MFINGFKTFWALSLLSLSISAQAEIVHSDWLSEGDKQAALDTTSGLEWLSLEVSKGVSIASYKSEPDLDGWRLPTASEVTHFLNEMFAPLALQDGGNFDDKDEKGYSTVANLWKDFLGATFEGSGGSFYSYGYHQDDNGAVGISGARITNPTSSDSATLYYNYFHPSFTENSSSHGLFLVSDGGTTLSSKADPSINMPANAVSDVSVGNLGAFAMLGALMLGFRRQKTTGELPSD